MWATCVGTGRRRHPHAGLAEISAEVEHGIGSGPAERAEAEGHADGGAVMHAWGEGGSRRRLGRWARDAMDGLGEMCRFHPIQSEVARYSKGTFCEAQFC